MFSEQKYHLPQVVLAPTPSSSYFRMGGTKDAGVTYVVLSVSGISTQIPVHTLKWILSHTEVWEMREI